MYPDLSEEVVREISGKIESSSPLFSDNDESESLVRSMRSKYDLKVGRYGGNFEINCTMYMYKNETSQTIKLEIRAMSWDIIICTMKIKGITCSMYNVNHCLPTVQTVE